MTTVLKDISYGAHERNVIDIYIPDNPKNSSGLVLIIHGGGWVSGDKSIHLPDAEYWSGLGYICGIMNYRFVSENVDVFDELDDITAALKTAKDVCKNHNINLRRVLLSGGSAGAHLSLMYACTKAGESPLTPVAAFCRCPPVDLSAPDCLMGASGEFEEWKYGVLSYCCAAKITKSTFGSSGIQNALKRISPINYVNDQCVPTAVCNGIHDELVPYNQVVRFLGILNNHNVRHDLIVYENSGHALDKDPSAEQKAKELMEEYITQYLY